MSWFSGIFAKKESVLPTGNPASPPTAPLQEVVVNNRNSSAPPPSVVPTTSGSVPNAVVVQPRRGEYVALGGRRKSKSKKSKSKKSKKSKSRKSKKSKKSRSRK